MNHSTRRDFLQTTAGLLAIGFAATSFDSRKNKPLLAFTTLGCPEWTFPNIVKFAVANGYRGLEIRGILRELDLTKVSEFRNIENILSTRKLMDANGLKFVGLGSSAQMHHREPSERLRNIDEAKRFIDLADELKCPYIRVFPNNFPKDQEHDATIDLIVKGLVELGDHAKGTDVRVLMETHGDLVQSADLEKIMKSSEHPHVGLVWDVVNMWSVTKEPPAQVYQKLKKYIYHTHIKDAKVVDDKLKYTLLGDGEAPIFEAIDALSKGGYRGYYCFEWEKLWHPELESPEIALANYPKVMQQHFKKN